MKMNGLFKLVLSATTTTALRCMFALLSRDSKGAINIKLVLRLRADVLWMRERRFIRTGGGRHGDALSVVALRRFQMQSEKLESGVGFGRKELFSDALNMAVK